MDFTQIVLGTIAILMVIYASVICFISRSINKDNKKETQDNNHIND